MALAGTRRSPPATPPQILGVGEEVAGALCAVRLGAAAALWACITYLSADSVQLSPLFHGTFAAFAVLTVMGFGLARPESRPGWWAPLDTALSLAALSGAAHQSGGLASPLLPLYGVAIVAAGVLSSPRAALVSVVGSALGIAGFVGLAAAGEMGDLAPAAAPAHVDPLVNVILILAVAGGSLPVARSLRLSREAMAAAVEELRAARAVQEPLFELAQCLQGTGTLGDVVQRVVVECRKALGVEWVFLYLNENDQADGPEALVGVAVDGPRPESDDAREILQMNPRILSPRALRQIGAFPINDPAESLPPEHPLVARLGARTILLVPLVGARGPLGIVLCADTRPGSAFDRRREQAAKVLVAQGAAAIENAQLLERITEEAENMTALLAVAERLSASVDLPEVLETVGSTSSRLLRCAHATVLVRDSDKDTFVVHSRFGPYPGLFPHLDLRELPVALVPLAARLESGGSVVLDSTEVPALLGDESLSPAKPCQVLAMPMLARGGLQGLLLFGFGREAPSASVLPLAEGVARQAVMAIENAQLVERLRRASHLKSEFLATMSHELRSPLHVIVGYADLLTEDSFGTLSVEQQDIIERIKRSSIQLLEMVNATLDVNRMDAGRMPIKLTKFTLPEFVRELDAETCDLPRADGVVLRWEVPRDKVTPVVADRGKLKTVVKNLVGNALKFTEKGSVTIEAQLDAAAGFIHISVRDTGIGMRQEDLGVVFDMFRQADGSDRRRFGGVGLGLYIVRRLLEQLGGEINVESTVGVGTVFTLRVPATTQGAVGTAEVEDGGAAVASGEEAPSTRAAAARS